MPVVPVPPEPNISQSLTDDGFFFFFCFFVFRRPAPQQPRNRGRTAPPLVRRSLLRIFHPYRQLPLSVRPTRRRAGRSRRLQNRPSAGLVHKPDLPTIARRIQLSRPDSLCTLLHGAETGSQPGFLRTAFLATHRSGFLAEKWAVGRYTPRSIALSPCTRLALGSRPNITITFPLWRSLSASFRARSHKRLIPGRPLGFCLAPSAIVDFLVRSLDPVRSCLVSCPASPASPPSHPSSLAA